MSRLRVGLDATPLLGAPTGIGRYVRSLTTGLLALPEAPELVLTELTLRRPAPGTAIPGARRSRRRVPARLLQAAWRRTDWPPVELLAGRVDVFHATNYVLPPLRRARGVLTVHDLSYLHHADTVSAATHAYRTLVPRGLRRADVVVVDAAAVGTEVVAEYGVDEARLVVAPLGVDDGWFDVEAPDRSWLAARGLPADYLLFVGSREPRKNLPVLLDAVRQLRASDPDLPPLVLVGPPGWGPALDASGLPEGAVRTPGYLAEGDLRRVVAGARLLAYPSRYEGFGLPPLEALACGTPVVASDLPVLREVLGPHATYAPVGDAAALAGAVADVLAAPPPAAAGVAHARTFTWRRTAERTLAAYRLALA
jgi:glycosyltransferase involved in cell wall biosynthesis